jgi:hypothetical protein
VEGSNPGRRRQADLDGLTQRSRGTGAMAVAASGTAAIVVLKATVLQRIVLRLVVPEGVHAARMHRATARVHGARMAAIN